MKHVELNKLNRHLYALTFRPQTISPMDLKKKKRIYLNYKKHKRSLFGDGNICSCGA